MQSLQYAFLGTSLMWLSQKIGRVLYKQYYHDRVEETLLQKDMQGIHVIVTGANEGVGFEVAKQLAKQGAHVILACRNKKKTERCMQRILKCHPHAQLEYEYMDLENQTSLYQFADRMSARLHRIDILINNASIYQPTGKQTLKSGMDKHWAINYLGTMALTLGMIKTILRDNTKVIMVGTDYNESHYKQDIPNSMVNFFVKEKMDSKRRQVQSKLALTYMSQALAYHIARKHPTWKGSIVTAHPGTISMHLWDIVGKAPFDGAQTILYCALHENINNGCFFEHANQVTLEGPLNITFLEQEYLYKTTLQQLQIDDPF